MDSLANRFTIIVAVDSQGGFAKDHKIPWHFPEDFKRFQKLTKNHICVMGRHTYEEILQMRKERDIAKNITTPINEILPDRESFVITKSAEQMPGATKIQYIREVADKFKDDKRTIFILGGRRLFDECLPNTSTVYMTIIKQCYDCDMFFPVSYLNNKFKITEGEQTDILYFVKYERIKP